MGTFRTLKGGADKFIDVAMTTSGAIWAIDSEE